MDTTGQRRIKNKMASSLLVDPSVTTLNRSKARQRRKTRKETSLLNKENNTLNSTKTESVDLKESNNETAIEEADTSRLIEEDQEPLQRQQETVMDSNNTHTSQVNDECCTPMRSGQTSNNTNNEVEPPLSVVYINVEVDQAAPIKAKLLPSLLTIRVTFVNEVTGYPLKKSSQQISAVSYYENRQNVDYVMPIITKAAKIESTRKGQLVARWSEDIVFCESREHLLEADHVAILVELLVMSTTTAQSPYPIAWGILLPSRITLEKTIPVQLYRIPKRLRAIIKSSDLVAIQSPKKYPTLVYIKLSTSVCMPLAMEPTLRSVIPTMPEVSSKDNNLQSLLKCKFRSSTEEVDGGGGGDCDAIQWSRLPGQSCAITDEMAGSFVAGSDGCSTLAFSPSGRLLASACVNNGNQTIINIFQLVKADQWEDVCSLQSGLGIVYDCQWSHDETKLACASASGICHVWYLAEDFREELLPHPSYVYALQWVLESTLLVTGCYDGAIRCWKEAKLMEVILTGSHRINTLCYDNSSSKLYSGSVDGHIAVWSVITDLEGDESSLKRDRILDIPTIAGTSVQRVIVVRGQQRLVVHALNTPYLVVDLRLDKVTTTFTPPEPIRHPSAVCVTPCGNLLITNNTKSPTTYTWDLNNGTLISKQRIRGLRGPLSSIVYHPFDHMALYTSIGPNQRIIIMKK